MFVSNSITISEFLNAAKDFVEVSNKLNDGWKLIVNNDINKSYLLKNTFTQILKNKEPLLLKTEYIIFYNISYRVPSFSFNIWNCSGVLLTIEDIRKMAFINIGKKEFYSVVSQQEHPLFHRPYFIIHPCHSEQLLAAFNKKTKNIIVTFLGLVTPLIRISLPLEYGL